ncbi:MAG: UDP-glucose--hexose-1-phosphate uridylyltransferase [Terriglobia bacterium]
MDSNLQQVPHRRFNPLTREWVIVSPHRTARPWLGKVEELAESHDAIYSPDCYLCPGNARAGGIRNPAYPSTYVFDNDYPALLAEPPEPSGRGDAGGSRDSPSSTTEPGSLLLARAEAGICRVLCFSPRHDLTIPRMTEAELSDVLTAWSDQYRSLGGIAWVRHVQIFENRGALMGASNPHPHCQIWATESIPNQPAKEQASLGNYFEEKGACLLCDYLRLELKSGERIVCENAGFAALVPYWAVWPFEVLVISKRHLGAITGLGSEEQRDLASLLKRLTTRYDNLFQAPFPYSMGFHQRPLDGASHAEWHFHAHYYPPLLRSATIQKFMVGFEMLGTPQRDITPETAAARLRDAGETHYLDSGAGRRQE